MATSLTLRSTKGAPLTHNEVDANFTALRDTADAAASAVAGIGGKANASALGVTDSATNMGTFTGSIISDDQTAKQVMQALETAILSILSGGMVFDLPDEANGDTIPASGSKLPYLSAGVLKIA